jgi:hypothetical protein
VSRKPEIKIDGLFNASEDYGYGPEQWAVIVRDLHAKLKIDVAKTIRFADPAWGDDKPSSRLLGDVLQELASYFGALARLEDHRLTPKQQSAKAKSILTKLKVSHAGGLTDLGDLILELERRKQRYDKDGRRDNAVKTHTRFWLALMRLWRAIPDAGRGDKNLHAFLAICSKPVFPKATTETTLTAFIERYSPQTNI